MNGRRLPTLILLAACVPASDPGADPVAALFSNASSWVDLSWPFNASTIYWPTATPFRLDTVASGMTEGGYYYAAFDFRAAEHGGTHLDAPVHFAEGRDNADEIPLDRLVGPAAVVDVSEAVGSDPDYLVSVEDLARFERQHGPVGEEHIVLIRTGWGRRWPDRSAYLGTDRVGPEAVPLLHFPGLDSAAAAWLVERRIAAIGIDTPSIDRGQSTDFLAHRVLYGANIPGFENVANLERLPATGAYVIALPTKIEGGSGGPLRIVAVVP